MPDPMMKKRNDITAYHQDREDWTRDAKLLTIENSMRHCLHAGDIKNRRSKNWFSNLSAENTILLELEETDILLRRLLLEVNL